MVMVITKPNLKTILVQLPAVKIAPVLDLYSPSDFFGRFASFHNTARPPSISSTCLSLSFRLVNAIHVIPVTNCKFKYIIYVYIILNFKVDTHVPPVSLILKIIRFVGKMREYAERFLLVNKTRVNSGDSYPKSS